MKKKLQFSSGVLQSMRRPSHPFAGPIARKKNETPGEAPALRREPKPVMPLIRVSQWTVGGASVLGLVFFLFGAGRFGLGMFLGSLMALFSLYSLKVLTSKVVQSNNPKGMWIFHTMNFVRWFLLAIFCYLLLKISVSCLLGAVASYVWFLAVLAFFGIRSAKPDRAGPAK